MEIESLTTEHLSRSAMGVKVVKVVSPSLFWVHLTHCNAQFEDLMEDLDVYMERKKDRLRLAHYTLKENSIVTAYTYKGWQRAIIAKINEDETVQLFLRDWGICKRHSKYDLYELKNQFRELHWHAIPCGLAHAGPISKGNLWPHNTKELTKMLAENHEGKISVIKPIDDGALVRLSILRGREGNRHCENLLEDLIRLGHAEKRPLSLIINYPTSDKKQD